MTLIGGLNCQFIKKPVVIRGCTLFLSGGVQHNNIRENSYGWKTASIYKRIAT